MIQTKLAMAFTALLVALGLILAPRLSRRGLFFGWSVAPEFPGSPAGRRVFRLYALALAAATAVTIVIGLIEVKMGAVGLFLILATHLAALRWARRQIEPHRIQPDGRREASLVARPTTLPGGWIAWLLPLAIPPVLLLLNAQYWESLPSRIPIHYGIDGQADRWVAKTWWSVNALPLLGFSTGLALLLMARQLAQSRRVSPLGTAAESESGRQRFMLLMLLSTLYLLNTLFATLTLRNLNLLGGVPPMLIIAALTVFWIITMALCWRHAEKRRELEPPLDGTPDECWHLGMFYANPQDPAILVEQRLGFGYTLNFGRPTAWAILLLILLPPIGMSFLK